MCVCEGGGGDVFLAEFFECVASMKWCATLPSVANYRVASSN